MVGTSSACAMLWSELAESEELDDDVPIEVLDSDDGASHCASTALD